MYEWWFVTEVMQNTKKEEFSKIIGTREEFIVRKRNREQRKYMYWNETTNYYKIWQLQTFKYNIWTSKSQFLNKYVLLLIYVVTYSLHLAFTRYIKYVMYTCISSSKHIGKSDILYFDYNIGNNGYTIAYLYFVPITARVFQISSWSLECINVTLFPHFL